jgi:hypothetical protein
MRIIIVIIIIELFIHLHVELTAIRDFCKKCTRIKRNRGENKATNEATYKLSFI